MTTIMFNGQPLTTFAAGGVRQTYMGMAYLTARGCPVEYLHSAARPGRVVRASALLSTAWAMLFSLRRVAGRHNVLFIDYSQRFAFGAFGVLARRLAGTRLAVQVQCTYFVLTRSAVRRALDRFVSRVLCRSADLVIVAGHALHGEVVRWGVDPRKVRIIYPALRPEFVGRARRSRPSVAGRPLELLFVGRITPIKGLEYLLQALACLKTRDVRLTVVGPRQAGAGYLEMIDRLVNAAGLADRVRFAGHVQDVSALLALYERADVFVLPSLWDTSPIAVVEAMAMELPVVATRVGSIPEWVADGESGMLVPPRDVEALAASLARLADDAGLRERMARSSWERSLAYQRRTWDEVGEEYREAFASVAAGPADRCVWRHARS